jgi:ketosteroid isomerase-like protein
VHQQKVEHDSKATSKKPKNAHEFAKEWIATWNSHDLDKILSHYSNDFEITSPFIKSFVSPPADTLRGKPAIRDYWAIALARVPDLRFELYDATEGVSSVTLYYKVIKCFSLYLSSHLVVLR